MQYLERLSQSPKASWYAVRGEHQGPVSRYVVSTPQSRDICNRPEIIGVEFNYKLHDAMAAALEEAPFRALVEDHPEERVCVVNFLRGGLNFEIRRALHTAFGFNRHSSAFMSSQRFREDGRWFVKEDMYRKLEIPKNALLIMGDVVATGVTMGNGLAVILDHIEKLGTSIRGLVFFTIGCHKAEKILDDVDKRARELFPDYEETVLVYLEAKFRLVDSKTELRIGIPGTDLIRKQALLSPELERSTFDGAAPLLERCAIYDAGSRAFDIPTYVGDVLEYWEQMAAFAEEGWTLADAIADRWHLEHTHDVAAFIDSKRSQWPNLEEDYVQDLHRHGAALLNRGDLSSPEALKNLCLERIETLRKVGGMRRSD
jgi:hypothetical protein